MTASLLIQPAAAKPQSFLARNKPPKESFSPELEKASGPPKEKLLTAANGKKATQAEATDNKPNAYREVLDSLEEKLPPEVAEAVIAWLTQTPQPNALPLDLRQIQEALTAIGLEVPGLGQSFASVGAPPTTSMPSTGPIPVPADGAAETPQTEVGKGTFTAKPGDKGFVIPTPQDGAVMTTPINKEGIVYRVEAPTVQTTSADAGVSNEAIKNFLLGGKGAAGDEMLGDGSSEKDSAEAFKAEDNTPFTIDPKPTRAEGHSFLDRVMSHQPKPVEAPAPVLQADTQNAVRQQAIDQILEMAAERPGRAVTVRLNPEELGTITVQLLHKEEGHEVQIKASNESVRSALGQAKHELAQTLENKGVNLLSFDVGSDATHADTSAHREQLTRDDFAASHRLFGSTGNDTARDVQDAVSRFFSRGVNYLA